MAEVCPWLLLRGWIDAGRTLRAVHPRRLGQQPPAPRLEGAYRLGALCMLQRKRVMWKMCSGVLESVVPFVKSSSRGQRMR